MGVRTPSVRPMTPADVAAVADLECRGFCRPVAPGSVLRGTGAPRREYVVVEDGGKMVAYGGLMLIDEDAHIMTIAVIPSRRREGLGIRVMLALCDAALERGARHLTLEVRETNQPPPPLRAFRVHVGGASSSLLPGQRGRHHHVGGRCRCARASVALLDLIREGV